MIILLLIEIFSAIYEHKCISLWDFKQVSMITLIHVVSSLYFDYFALLQVISKTRPVLGHTDDIL